MHRFKSKTSSQTKSPREFSWRALLLGALLGLVFGIGNTYLGLKIGTTVSASIPAAVLSMALLRLLSKRATILENNIVQTVASVGEGLAAGVIFTAPALFILGEPPSIFRLCLLTILGGMLGILFMIPMRRFLIVQEHGILPFPEGTACAKILKSGQAGAHEAWMPFLGICVGALYKFLASGLHLLQEIVVWKTPRFLKTELSIDCTPALLGVGFIIGPSIAAILFFGGMLGWCVLIPLVTYFGSHVPSIIYPAHQPIFALTPTEIWSQYIRYIGAGAVAMGGFLSLIKVFPSIVKTLKASTQELFAHPDHRKHLPKTEQDISLRWLIFGSITITLLLWLWPTLPMNLLTVGLLVVLGFFFVAVTSITVGIVGSTSNPVSGMTITTLLITCLVFVSLGWTEKIYLLSALTMSIVANVAIAMAATTSQDLKTGFLLGATPKKQQIAELVSLLIPSIAIACTLYLLSSAYTFGSTALPAPQGTLMALIAQGVISGHVPLFLLVIGAILGLLVSFLKIPVLPFAMGLYLPLSLSTAAMVGALVSTLVGWRKKPQEALENKEKGTLIASGLVAGDACMGVALALFSIMGWISSTDQSLFKNGWSFFFFVLLSIFLFYFSSKREYTKRSP